MNNPKTNDSARVFLQAVSADDLRRARALLAEDPTLAGAADSNGKTALHVAAERDNAEMVQTLLDCGADPDAEATWGHTPLQWAGVVGSRQAADRLISRRAKGLDPPTAAGLGMFEAVRDFWDGDGALLSSASFRKAVRNKDGSWSFEAVHDPREIVSEAFYLACRNGRLEIARWLLKRGADLERRGFFGGTGLHWASLNGHLETVRFLVEAGADIEAVDHQFKTTPISWANEGRRSEVVDFLLARGARCTASQAAAFGRLDVLRTVLEREPGRSWETGRDVPSPLWQAARFGRKQVVEWLIERGADVNAPTVAGETPLHAAASGNDPEILRILLRHGANPNVRSDSGVTPLHATASRGDAESTGILLEAGADATAKLAGAATAADLAERTGHHSLAETLRKAESGAAEA